MALLTSGGTVINLIKVLLVRFVLARYLVGGVGSLAVALPIMAILKSIGTPLLVVLGIVALPVLFILFVVGLPVFAVLLVAAALLGLVAMVFLVGIVALKVFIFVVLPILCIVGIVRWIRGSGRTHTEAPVAG